MPNKSSKKRKTNHHHHHQIPQPDDLSHAEVWDDSALIRSWNDALAEYDFYHSIHAKGEDVDEVLRRAELSESTAVAAADEDVEDGEVTDDDDEGAGEPLLLRSGDTVVPPPEEAGKVGGRAEQRVPQLPNGTLHDEQGRGGGEAEGASAAAAAVAVADAVQTLENVKMAYYWAGYYSGLYEAQLRQQGQAGPQQGKP